MTHWVEQNGAVFLGRALVEYLKEHKYYPGTSVVGTNAYRIDFYIEAKFGKIQVGIYVLDNGAGNISINLAKGGLEYTRPLEHKSLNFHDPNSFPAVVETIQKWITPS